MHWQYERCFVFFIGPGGKEWFCERCCWSQKAPRVRKSRKHLRETSKLLFDDHDCELFARENWVDWKVHKPQSSTGDISVSLRNDLGDAETVVAAAKDAGS
jgi:hypothetical protein